jgi:polyhydroxyalkanoate synthesis regulator phasin
VPHIRGACENDKELKSRTNLKEEVSEAIQKLERRIERLENTQTRPASLVD